MAVPVHAGSVILARFTAPTRATATRNGFRSALLALAFAGANGGCAAAYPTFSTNERPAPTNADLLEPAPPDDLLFLRLEGATIPERTRDGREWDEVGGSAPDPFAIVYLDGAELFRTQPQANTLKPNWPGSPEGNFRIPPRAVVRIELFDHNSMKHRPICLVELTRIADAVLAGGRRVECESGATLALAVKPARATLGLGLSLEVRGTEVVVTRVLPESPAARAGVAVGAKIVAVEGRPASDLHEGEVRSLFRSRARTGLSVSVLEADGTTRTIELEDGPIYAVAGPLTSGR